VVTLMKPWRTLKKNVLIEGPEFVKEAIIFAMEHKAYDRELVSQLLGQVYNIFLAHDMQNGFQRLLDRLPDLVIDIPSARELLGKFIARAIHDEILAPAFLKEAQLHNKDASHVISLAYETTNAPEKKRMDRIWGAGALVSVRRLRKEVRQILGEYLDHQDTSLTMASIKDLDVPHFNVEVVKHVIELALEQNSIDYSSRTPDSPKDKGKLMHLLCKMEEIALLSKNDVQQAFVIVANKESELAIDIPHTKEILSELKAVATQLKLL